MPIDPHAAPLNADQTRDLQASAVEALAGMVVPDRVRIHTEKHMVRIGRGDNADDIRRAQERAEGFVEGLEVAGALNAATIEALYIAIEHAATARQIELGRQTP